MAVMRVALLMLVCTSSASAGSISLRGAVEKTSEKEEHVKPDKKEGQADPCDMEAKANVSQAVPDHALRSATRQTVPNTTYGYGYRVPLGEVMTLYHQTSAEIAALILKGGFKPGRVGWCGGGIYFAVKPWETYHKAIGPDSHLGVLIEAKVDLGKVRHMPPTCDRSMTAEKMFRDGYDSIRFNPGDGDEIVVYSPDSVLSMEHFKWS